MVTKNWSTSRIISTFSIVGAVATQATAEVSFGPRGLELLARGVTPDEILNILTGEDVVIAMEKAFLE